MPSCDYATFHFRLWRTSVAFSLAYASNMATVSGESLKSKNKNHQQATTIPNTSQHMASYNYESPQQFMEEILLKKRQSNRSTSTDTVGLVIFDGECDVIPLTRLHLQRNKKNPKTRIDLQRRNAFY